MLRKIKYITITALALIITLTIFYSTGVKKNEKIECHSHVTILNRDQKLTMMMIFTSLKEGGQVEINGYYQDNNNPLLSIHRTIRFTEERHHEQYIMRSISVTKNFNDEIHYNETHNLLPDFFLLSNKSLSLKVKTMTNGHRMIYLSGMPVYYCYNNH